MATYTTITKPSATFTSIHKAGTYHNTYYLLNEDGGYLLNEDGGRLVLENGIHTTIDKPSTTYTTITKPT